MKPELRAYLGKEVEIQIDRPLGSTHPQWPEMRYPINYGFLPGTVSGDGHPIDVYLLGVDEPVQTARGTVIAVVVRADDDEDKLVVAPHGARFTHDQICGLLEFQERYFSTRLEMYPGLRTE